MNKKRDIISRIEEVCDIDQLTMIECGKVVGYFKSLAEKKAIVEQEHKPHRTPNHTANITMIKCNSK